MMDVAASIRCLVFGATSFGGVIGGSRPARDEMREAMTFVDS